MPKGNFWEDEFRLKRESTLFGKETRFSGFESGRRGNGSAVWKQAAFLLIFSVVRFCAILASPLLQLGMVKVNR